MPRARRLARRPAAPARRAAGPAAGTRPRAHAATRPGRRTGSRPRPGRSCPGRTPPTRTADVAARATGRTAPTTSSTIATPPARAAEPRPPRPCPGRSPPCRSAPAQPLERAVLASASYARRNDSTDANSTASHSSPGAVCCRSVRPGPSDRPNAISTVAANGSTAPERVAAAHLDPEVLPGDGRGLPRRTSRRSLGAASAGASRSARLARTTLDRAVHRTMVRAASVAAGAVVGREHHGPAGGRRLADQVVDRLALGVVSRPAYGSSSSSSSGRRSQRPGDRDALAHPLGVRRAPVRPRRRAEPDALERLRHARGRSSPYIAAREPQVLRGR